MWNISLRSISSQNWNVATLGHGIPVNVHVISMQNRVQTVETTGMWCHIQAPQNIHRYFQYLSLILRLHLFYWHFLNTTLHGNNTNVFTLGSRETKSPHFMSILKRNEANWKFPCLTMEVYFRVSYYLSCSMSFRESSISAGTVQEQCSMAFPYILSFSDAQVRVSRYLYCIFLEHARH